MQKAGTHQVKPSIVYVHLAAVRTCNWGGSCGSWGALPTAPGFSLTQEPLAELNSCLDTGTYPLRPALLQGGAGRTERPNIRAGKL